MVNQLPQQQSQASQNTTDETSKPTKVRLITVLYFSFLVLWMVFSSLAAGFILPLMVERIGGNLLERTGLIFFPAFWFISIFYAVGSSWFYFIMAKVRGGSPKSVKLIFSTTVVWPFAWIGLFLLFKLFNLQSSQIAYGSWLSLKSLATFAIYNSIGLIAASLFVFSERRRFVNEVAPLTRLDKILITAFLVIPILLSSGYWIFAKATSVTAVENRAEISQKAGFKLLVPNYLPSNVKMHFKIREKFDQKLGLKTYRQFFDTLIFEKNIKLIVFNQGLNTNNANLTDFVEKRKENRDYAKINLANASGSEAYIAEIKSKDKAYYTVLFIHTSGIVCELIGPNITKEEFLKVAESI